MNGSLQIARIKKIPIKAHWSLLIALPWFAAIFTRHFVDAARVAGVPPEGLASPWLWGIALAVAVFFSVLLHELAHALYAARTGGKVADITLLLFGGISRVGPLKSSRQEAVMAFVGPLASLTLAAAAFSAYAFVDAGAFKLRFAFFCFGQLNLFLGLFNLLPAFPMDGGRVLRALLVGRMGAARATQIASTVGVVFAGLFAIVGFMTFNFVLLLIAFFVYIGAKDEGRIEALKELLGDTRVRDLMSAAASSVDARTMLDEAADVMIAQRRPVLAVADSGAVVGVLLLEDIRRVPAEKRRRTKAAEIAVRAPAVRSGDDAWRALELMTELGVPELPVLDEAVLVGTISHADIERGVKLLDFDRATHRPVPA